MVQDLKDKNILVIVESPNKCATISNILKKAGYNNVTVSASFGHIMELGDGGSYHNSGISPEKEFDMNLKISSDKSSTVNKLKAQARASDFVYIMSDGDREGELIAWSLIKFLGLNPDKYYRAITHEITPKAVIAAIENPVKISNALVEAALARLTIDKMIGYSLSPIAKAYVGARSVGRCQSAGLKLVVDREREIQNFEPEYYYDLFLTFSKNQTDFRAKYVGTILKKLERIPSTDTLNTIKFECTGPYAISDIQHITRTESPKPPFCTATFQQEAANKLGLKVKDAMSCAQKLFEGISIDGKHTGLITYMRTDATDMAKDFVSELKSYITASYGKTVYRAPKTGPKAQTAQEGHEALRVTNINLTPELAEKYLKNERLAKVYKLIWQRTVASAMQPAEYDETSYTINNNNHLFTFVQSELRIPGYKLIYERPQKPQTTESFSLAEVLENTKLISEAKQTTPPPRYKEATLIKELQKREIGRPSTYVTIIETVLSPNRGYCVLEDKTIMPTDRGIQLANFLDRAFSQVINLDYTKELEASLDAIANKKLTKIDFLQDFYRVLENAISTNKETAGSTLQLNEKLCPNCGSPMVVRRSRYGKLFYGCSQYPNCRGIIGID